MSAASSPRMNRQSLRTARSCTCMTTSTDWPRGGPAKDRETSGNEGMLKRRNSLLNDPFQCVLACKRSGCIEFLNRESQVRFLPGALRSFRGVIGE
jgi:hypothetical protein